MRVELAALLAIGLVGSGCELFEPTAEEVTQLVKAKPKQPQVPMRPSDEVAAHMREHFDLATSVKLAVIEGDLDKVKTHASALAKHEAVAELPKEALPFVESMKQAAMHASQVKDLPAAGAAVGEIALTCGNCHGATDATPRFHVVPKPAASKETKDQMALHQWAADRLWEGIVGPSAPAWDLGSRELTAAPMCVDAAAAENLPGDGKELQQKVHGLSAKAAKATTLPERAKLYGELLATCATCHTSGC